MSKAIRFCSSFSPLMTNELQKSNGRGRIIRYAPLILWISVILFLSTSQASMSNTSRFIRPLLEFLFPGASEETLILYHGFIRKLAHLTEYAGLAFWAFWAFSNSNLKNLRRLWFVFAFLLVLLIALIDETNQSRLTSRTGSIYDVLLDILGGLIMLISLILYRFRKNT